MSESESPENGLGGVPDADGIGIYLVHGAWT